MKHGDSNKYRDRGTERRTYTSMDACVSMQVHTCLLKMHVYLCMCIYAGPYHTCLIQMHPLVQNASMHGQNAYISYKCTKCSHTNAFSYKYISYICSHTNAFSYKCMCIYEMHVYLCMCMHGYVCPCMCMVQGLGFRV